MESLIDCGRYYLSPSAQGTEIHKHLRLSLLTASNFGYLFTNDFKTPSDLANVIKTSIADEKKNEAIEKGLEYEPIIREWYAEYHMQDPTTNFTEAERRGKVRQIGLAIPKFDSRIGCSPDGLVGEEGMIEIKTSKARYWRLNQRLEYGTSTIPHAHIFLTHRCQMQGCMAILGRKWCDYIMYGYETGEMFVQRIPFDKDFWDQVLYPEICNFFATHIEK